MDFNQEMARELAKKQVSKVYAPYSNFPVVCVLESTDKRLYAGVNIENVAFNPTLHAEGCAVAVAMMDGVRERLGQGWIKTIYLWYPDAHRIAPCGYCRQTLHEFAHPDCVWIGECSKTGQTGSATLRELLPYEFGPTDL